MAELRLRLSPRGDIVSEMGKQRTVELFGESLSPQQVVERICSDVERDGLAAMLDYTARLDGKRVWRAADAAAMTGCVEIQVLSFQGDEIIARLFIRTTGRALSRLSCGRWACWRASTSRWNTCRIRRHSGQKNTFLNKKVF